jgi:hypothetical protein
MTTSYVLTRLASEVRKKAPTAKMKISRESTWADVLSAVSKSLEEVDQGIRFIPQQTKERREAVKKLALSDEYRAVLNNPLRSSASVVHRIRTPFPGNVAPRPPRRPRPPRERVRQMAKEVLEQGFRQPYALNLRAARTENTLATVRGELTLRGIDAEEDDLTSECELKVESMLWDSGSHSCIITSDILPE